MWLLLLFVSNPTGETVMQSSLFYAPMSRRTRMSRLKDQPSKRGKPYSNPWKRIFPSINQFPTNEDHSSSIPNEASQEFAGQY